MGVGLGEEEAESTSFEHDSMVQQAGAGAKQREGGMATLQKRRDGGRRSS